jgi:hypothetical protein
MNVLPSVTIIQTGTAENNITGVLKTAKLFRIKISMSLDLIIAPG